MSKAMVFFYTALFFVGGVAVRSFWSVPDIILYVFFGSGAGFFIYGIGEQMYGTKKQFSVIVLTGLFIFSFCIGIYRLQWTELENKQNTVIAYVEKESVSIVGTIIEEPEVRKKNVKLTIDVEQVGQNTVNGAVVIFADRYGYYDYGDSIRVTGKLQKPESFDNFDYPAYLARNNIYAVMYYPDVERVTDNIKRGYGAHIKKQLYKIKKSFETNIEQMLPEPHAAFLMGLLLGSRTNLPESVLEDFRITGVLHIIALSGYNITIIAMMLTRSLQYITTRTAVSFWVSVICIVLFTIMVGASASIVRAAIMGLIVLLAKKEGRRYAAPNALVFAGAIMIYHTPTILRFDISFQLSFMATVGLMYGVLFFKKYTKSIASYGGMRDVVITTLSAQIAVLPLILYYFGTISLISPLANMFILIAVPFTMLFGFLGALTGFISSTGSILIGSAAFVLLDYQIRMVEILSSIPYAHVYIGHISISFVVILYGLLWRGIYKS